MCFTRRDVRAALGWGDTQLKIHLARLLEMEYLLLFRRGLTYEYGLLWDGEENDSPHLSGLLDATGLPYRPVIMAGNVNRSGSDANRSADGRGAVGGRSDTAKTASAQAEQGAAAIPVGAGPNAAIRGKHNVGINSLLAGTPTEVSHS